VAVEVAVLELVGIAQKAVVTGCRTALGPARLFVAGGGIEMQKIERGPREPGKGTALLDQPFPDADTAFGRLPAARRTLGTLRAGPRFCFEGEETLKHAFPSFLFRGAEFLEIAGITSK